MFRAGVTTHPQTGFVVTGYDGLDPIRGNSLHEAVQEKKLP